MLAAGGTEPISPPATKNKASEYQAVCSALGVPWDITLLVDTQRSQDEEKTIDDYNPLETALCFAKLVEREYKITEENTEDENGNEVIIQHKTLVKCRMYVGTTKILSYLGIQDVRELAVSSLFDKASKIATSKNTGTTSYEVTFQENSEIEQVLTNLGFNEDETKNIIDLHNSRYIILLYNGSETVIGNIKLDMSEFKQNEDAVWHFLKEIGFSDIGAAAVMGNAKIESSFNPTANHNNHYFGLFQWGGGRWNGNEISLSEFSKSGSWCDLETQLNFFNLECSKSYENVYNQMKTATDLVYATDYFCVWYEGCIGNSGNWAYSVINNKAYQCLADRRAYAQAYYQKYASGEGEETQT